MSNLEKDHKEILALWLSQADDEKLGELINKFCQDHDVSGSYQRVRNYGFSCHAYTVIRNEKPMIFDILEMKLFLQTVLPNMDFVGKWKCRICKVHEYIQYTRDFINPDKYSLTSNYTCKCKLDEVLKERYLAMKTVEQLF